MKYTLLDLVQRVLESMESDEVSTVNETPESRAVVGIIKECYFDIVGQGNLAEHEGLFKLDASTDNTKPTLMYLPDNCVRLDWVKYNMSLDLTKPHYVQPFYVTNKDFLRFQGQLEPSDPDIGSMQVEINSEDFWFRFYKDRAPRYYTIFDEKNVIFDGYVADLEDTLTQTRTNCWGLLSVSFLAENDFIPDLDPRQFQLLLQDAKSTAFIELKQAANPKAEQKYRRNFILSQKTKHDNNPEESFQKRMVYGRRPR